MTFALYPDRQTDELSNLFNGYCLVREIFTKYQTSILNSSLKNYLSSKALRTDGQTATENYRIAATKIRL